ncbi:MAG: SigE family RNA polymerase sigma factor [bacterium]|nr:SigE family RNA polymerase sigma factor [bacterium]MCP4967050.1 SigE family RNA polymerase sigma factor [bacterium]
MAKTLPLLAVAEDFESFYQRQYPRAVGLAYALAGKRHLAEEIAQDAFIAGYRRWDRISRYERPELWLRRVVVNRSTSVLRRRMTEVKAIPRLRAASESMPPLEPNSDAVWDSVRDLPRRQAQTVALFYLEDLPIEQIADILECSPGSVKTHLRRARERLGHKLHAWKEEL